MTEFQPRIIASFNRLQFEEATEWWRENGIIDSGATDFNGVVNEVFMSSEFDERGKTLNEKGRNRLKIAMMIITSISKGQLNIDDIIGDIKVWQLTPDPENITIRTARRTSRRQI